MNQDETFRSTKDTQSIFQQKPSKPKIIISQSPQVFSEKVLSFDGDEDDVRPESEKDLDNHQNRSIPGKKQRLDKFNNKIIKGSKEHRIVFRDQFNPDSPIYNIHLIEDYRKYYKSAAEEKDVCCQIQ